MYLLEWETTAARGKLRSPHALEIPLVFDNVGKAKSFMGRSDPQVLADQMSEAWLAFARTGNPATQARGTMDGRAWRGHGAVGVLGWPGLTPGHDRQVGAEHRIQSIPTMAVFQGGREVARTMGARPAAQIEGFVRQAIGVAA